MESDIGNEVKGENEIKKIDSPVDIGVHSIRKRLPDVDGASAKAAIDGIVAAGILQDDSPEFVRSIKYTQSKGEKEKTLIILEWREI